MIKPFAYSLSLLVCLVSFGQDLEPRSFFFTAGVSYSDPSGELVLIRGTRKIVRTNFSAAPSYTIKFGKRLNQNSELSLSLGYANYTYENKEDYTDGFKNYSSDDFNYIPLYLNYDKLLDVNSWQIVLGGHAGIAFYGKEVNLLSELHLLGTPVDQWPSHPDMFSPLDLEIQNNLGIGIHGGLRRDLVVGRLFAELNFSATYTQFVAKILDDPEDDGDEDVNLDTNPVDVGIQIGYRF